MNELAQTPGAIRSRKWRKLYAERINGRKRDRYKTLRALGCTVEESARLCDTNGAVEYAKERIEKGLRP